jgi:large subunit ribosomal protein L15
MYKLNNLKNTTGIRKPRKRVGRGTGSGIGKTCGRGEKGSGSRSGYKRRYGYEGGQFRLFMKLPIRGFSNFNFRKHIEAVNLEQIDKLFNDGDIVNEQTLREKGIIGPKCDGVKILGDGELTKKVKIEVDAISSSAKDKLQKAKISFKLLSVEENEE